MVALHSILAVSTFSYRCATFFQVTTKYLARFKLARDFRRRGLLSSGLSLVNNDDSVHLDSTFLRSLFLTCKTLESRTQLRLFIYFCTYISPSF